MKRSSYTKGLFLLITVVLLFIGLGSHSIAAEAGTGTFSGRVVDVEGNPVAELPVMIGPTMAIGPGIRSAFSPTNYPMTRRARTDADGRFTITDITPRMSYFSALPQNVDVLFPRDLEAKIAKAMEEKDFATIHASGVTEMRRDDFEPDFEVLSLDIGGITFYPRDDFSQIGFSVEPGSHIKNVKVIVQPRMRIRGRVLFKDGTPLRNARLRLGFSYTHENGHGSSGGSPRTDADGYFLFCFDEKDNTANYIFSVEYQALETTAEPVLLEPGDRLDGLTFTFDSEPIAAKSPPHKMGFNPPATPPAPKPISIPTFETVWIVNPANGHAYTRIPCESREDAVAQAVEEKAHLVTINDAAEQAWLTAVFGHEFYWIGLSDAEKEGQWQWDNGEPVTYENWLPDDYFSEPADAGERVYAVTTFTDGKWSAVSPKSILLRMTAMAILEKANSIDNSPTKENNSL
jgi:hypothetical protein